MPTAELLPPKCELVSAKLEQVNAAGPNLPIGHGIAPLARMASPSKGDTNEIKKLLGSTIGPRYCTGRGPAHANAARAIVEPST
jgi:hypothetical protein